jgi:hypothetical protein
MGYAIAFCPCTHKYRFLRYVRLTKAYDQNPRTKFGFPNVQTENMITHIGFGQFGFGPGYFGLELRSSVFMPTPNPN